MINFFFFLFSLLSLHAATPQESASVSSESADYNGNLLVLRGNVALDHGLGQMTAEEAELERQETGKEFPFSLIRLKKEVVLTFKDLGKLQCAKADLDFQTMQGLLTSENDKQVNYTDKNQISISSRTGEIFFAKKDHDGKKTLYAMDRLTAKENVSIEYGQGYTLQTQEAVYYKQPLEQVPQSSGGLLISPSACRLTHQGDIVDAEKAHLFISEKTFTLFHPKGRLSSSMLSLSEGGKIDFNCNQLVWDNDKNQLHLKENIHLEEESLGILDADEELALSHALQKGKRILTTIKGKGPVTLQLNGEGDQKGALLASKGTIHIDRKRLHALIESPKVKGVVPEEKQIYFQEARIAGHADLAAIDFAVAEKRLRPQSITLRGNVRLFSQKSCGLADRVSFSPSTGTLILTANAGKKVLFWESEQNLRLSAPEVHVTIDPVTQTQVIKGIGHVQFSFSPEENALIKKIFPAYKEPAQ